MGTESRRPPSEFIPPSDTSYGTVVFRATEVKDLAIDPTPPTAGLFRDPAVLGVSRPMGGLGPTTDPLNTFLLRHVQAGPQPQGPYGGYPQPGYGQMPMGPPGPQNGPPRGMAPPPGHHGGYPQPPQQRYMNAAQPPQNAPSVQAGKPNDQSAQTAAATTTASAEGSQPQTQPQAPRSSPSAAAPNETINKEAPPATSRPNASVRSASVTLEKVERAMDELRQPVLSNNATPQAHSGRGGRRGGRGGGNQPSATRVQVPDTEFDFEAMNAKFDKASLRPNDSESDSDSGSDNDALNETDKKEKLGKFYNPQRSFFDDISSDSNLKNDGANGPRGM
jgi:protein LSM14